MTKSQKKELLSIITGAILLAAAVIVTKTVLKGPTWAVLLIFLVPYRRVIAARCDGRR